MKRLGALPLFLLAGCAGPAAWDSPIGARTIARLESGYQLRRNIQIVGVVDSASMNEAARVRVRNVICSGPERDRMTCTYDADQCLEGEGDGDGDGWCARVGTFVRWLAPPDPAFSDRGWFLERPLPED